MDVTNDQGLILFVISISAIKKPGEPIRRIGEFLASVGSAVPAEHIMLPAVDMHHRPDLGFYR